MKHQHSTSSHTYVLQFVDTRLSVCLTARIVTADRVQRLQLNKCHNTRFVCVYSTHRVPGVKTFQDDDILQTSRKAVVINGGYGWWK